MHPEKGSTGTPFKVVTYNIHRWVGMDGRADPERIIRVIRQIDADIVGLHEITFSADKAHGLEEHSLAEATGMHVVTGCTLLNRSWEFGNAVLSKHPVLEVFRHDMTVCGREPRGFLEVYVQMNGAPVRVVATHLGLRAYERRAQVKALLSRITAQPFARDIMLGDFNNWLPWSRLLKGVNAYFGAPPRLRTFPSRLPFLALDRIWVNHGLSLQRLSVHRSPLTRVASDHLPLKALVSMD